MNVSPTNIYVFFQIIFTLFSDNSRNTDVHSQASAPLSLGQIRSQSADRKLNRKTKKAKISEENMISDALLCPKKSLRNEWSQDSGNSSLNTSTTDSRRSGKSVGDKSRKGEDVRWGTEERGNIK